MKVLSITGFSFLRRQSQSFPLHLIASSQWMKHQLFLINPHPRHSILGQQILISSPLPFTMRIKRQQHWFQSYQQLERCLNQQLSSKENDSKLVQIGRTPWMHCMFHFITLWPPIGMLMSKLSIRMSRKGYITGKISQEWIKVDFDSQTHEVANGWTCLLIVDGHVSHFTQGFLEYAKTSNIEVLCLPPNTTHALQSAIFL